MRTFFFFVFWISITCSSMGQSLQLGVVTDFEQSPGMDSLFQLITNEINNTIGPARSVTLDPGNIQYGINTLQDAGNYYTQITGTSDLVILLGSISVKGSVDQGNFPIPTFGLGVVDPYLQELPYTDGKTGINNFSYIWAAKDIRTELMKFKEIVPFENLSLLVSEATSITFNQERGIQYIDSLKKLLLTEITIVPLGKDLETSLRNVPPTSDAAYISYLDGKTQEDIQIIANSLIDQGLPSFSGQKWHVDNGIMASISDDNDLEQVIRRLAIMVDEAIIGSPLSEMLVDINFKEDLHINAQTTKKIGLNLPFDILFTANFIDLEEDLPTYSLEQIMDKALENNFSIKISNQDIALAIQEAKFAKTSVLPTLDLGINAAQINPERASALFNTPERQLTGELSLDQLIYSEQALAGIKIAYYLQKAQESSTKAEILNILLDTYTDYFGVLAAKTVVEIEKENLENFKTNLDLARLRVNTGSASQAEIFRWESEVATASQSVVEATTNLLAAKFRLNTFLANTLEEDFDIMDVTIDDELYKQFQDSYISDFVNNARDIELVIDFFIDESLNNNPNKLFILQQINATERQKTQNKRLFYTPDIALQLQTQQTLLRGGAGSTEEPGMDSFQNNTWSIGAGLSFPIIDANRRKVNLQTSKIQLDQLENSRRQLDQELELAVRTSILSSIATTTNIEFSRISADNAVANFDLVRDRYRAGDISITQLIDAQQAALGAKQRYAVAVYDYLQAQLQLEFVIGSFSMFATNEERQQLENRFLQFRDNR